MNTPIKYVAQLKHVKEVSLRGSANLNFWEERLARESLVPIAREGKAQVMIVATDSKFKGIKFREVSFSVLASGEIAGLQAEGAYLIRAFNSCRFFAFCERVLFSTPYSHGDVRVATEPTTLIQVSQGPSTVFQAQMKRVEGAPREPATVNEGGWEGPVFLPRRPAATPHDGKFFFVKIGGATQTYPFVPSEDSAVISPMEGNAIQQLADSQFAGESWEIRNDAHHAKSKTLSQARG
jgi:hypothetical protein